MAKKTWNKKEDEILINNFSTIKWDELLEKLPEKTEQQILNRAAKLGLSRERELVEIYYDEEREAWVETWDTYGKIKIRSSSIIPAKKGTTFEEASNALGERIAKVFFETFGPKYNEFLRKFGLEHDKEIASKFFDMEIELFGTNDESKTKEIHNKFIEDIMPILKKKFPPKANKGDDSVGN